MRLGFLAFVALLGTVQGKSSGIEFVRACDSSSDDVTNQCINRIPDNIGENTGTPGCAYHEAEVRCLGLCGNTVTWKVAYQNALKRYRLVCASYISNRIAEKEDDGEAGGGSDDDDAPPKKKSKKKAKDDESEEDSDESTRKPSDDDSDDGAKSSSASKSVKPSSTEKSSSAKPTKPSKSVESKPTPKQKPSPTPQPKPPQQQLAKKKPATGEDSDDIGQGQRMGKDKDDSKSHGMLPTMDPALADTAPYTAAPAAMLVAVLVAAAIL
ncbi:hypothetical protein GGF46_003950 [Coemansia sp. RSA 552]|nr:hypothetical protein GGF46_003950 [Coemansia sp. RSA 552]